MAEILTYSAAKAEADKQRLLAEKYKAEADEQRLLAEKYKEEVLTLQKQLQQSQEFVERAAAAGMTVEKYRRMKEDEKREREALQAETEYGKRLRLVRS
jgi:hypothetical protein